MVPASVAILTQIPAFSDTALFGILAVLALLIFSDFGGMLKQRTLAYLATVAAGIPIMVLGAIAGQTITGAMIMMAGVALLLGILAVLRGFVASSQTTLLLATVIATTSSPPDSYATGAAAWVLGGLMATAAAVLLWPAPANSELRHKLCAVFQQVVEVVRLRWAPEQRQKELTKSLSELDSRIEELHNDYDGNLQRPAGVTAQDRALADLVEIAGHFRTYEYWSEVTPADPGSAPLLSAANHRLASAVADNLSQTSALLGGHDVRPSPDLLKKAREKHLESVSDWATTGNAAQPATVIRNHLDDVFPLRLTSASAELAAASALDATGSEAKSRLSDVLLSEEAARQHRGRWTRLKSHITLDSPWFRNALRSAMALAISVGIAKHLGLGHEFWIVLGTLSALRFDALGTGRTVIEAFLGTAAGVLLALPLIAIVGDQATVWWMLLPVSLFVAAYTPGTFSLATGQAGFTFAVLVLFSLLFPARIETAELRILEVTIGLVISVCIALLMWPRGVTATLYTRMSEAMATATDHLVASVDYTCGGAIDAVALAGYSQRSDTAIDRAQEAYDLSIAQKPPKTIPMSEWSRMSNIARHLDFAAHIFPSMTLLVQERGDQRTVPEILVGPMLDAVSGVRQQLRSTIRMWLQSNVGKQKAREANTSPGSAMARSQRHLDEEGRPASLAVERLRAALANYLSEPSDWHGDGSDPRPALVSWITDWAVFIEWNAAILQRVIKERDDIDVEPC